MVEAVIWRDFGATVLTLCSGWCWKPEEDADSQRKLRRLWVCAERTAGLDSLCPEVLAQNKPLSSLVTERKLYFKI